ncbi:MAG: hypothetical protein KGI04_04575 [Candidatus Micrarchaeota archaeon]|nr:hypothetical protein [Candidatus Micrarchaeota archaeon]
MSGKLKLLADYYLAKSIRVDDKLVEVDFEGEVRKEQIARAQSVLWELGFVGQNVTLVVGGEKITPGTAAAVARMAKNGPADIRIRPLKRG